MSPRREAKLEMMAHAGRELAIRWGHQPWSESWSRQVAETLLEAAEKIEHVLAAQTPEGTSR